MSYAKYESPIGVSDGSPNPSEDVFSLIDQENGVAVGQTAFEKAGDYVLSVKIDDIHVAGSPFNLEVAPTSISAEKSVIVLTETVGTADIPFTVQVQARDQYHNNIVTGNVADATIDASFLHKDDFASSVGAPDDPAIDYSQVPPVTGTTAGTLNDGTSQGSLLFEIAGSYSVAARIGQKSLSNSPLSLQVHPEGIATGKSVLVVD